jgi:hypothetical protein
LLHDKLEIYMNIGKQCKDIEITLVIGHIDAGDTGIYIFLPLGPYFDAANPENYFGPWNSNIEMYFSTIFVKNRNQEAPEAENGCTYCNKSIQP